MSNRSNVSLISNEASSKDSHVGLESTKGTNYGSTRASRQSSKLPSQEPAGVSSRVHVSGGNYLSEEIKIDKEGNVGWRKSLGRRSGKSIVRSLPDGKLDKGNEERASLAKRSLKTRPTIIPPPLPTISGAELVTLSSPTTPRQNTLRSSSPATSFRQRSQTITSAVPEFFSNLLRLKRSTNSLRGDTELNSTVRLPLPSASLPPSTPFPIKTMSQDTADDFIKRVEDLLPLETPSSPSQASGSRLYSLSSSSSSIFTREIQSPSPRKSFRHVSSTSTESTFDSEDLETAPSTEEFTPKNFPPTPQLRLEIGVKIASFEDLKRSVDLPVSNHSTSYLPYRPRKSISTPSSPQYSTALSPPPALHLHFHRPRDQLINSRRSSSHSIRSPTRHHGTIPLPVPNSLNLATLGSRSMVNLSSEVESKEHLSGGEVDQSVDVGGGRGSGNRLRIPFF